MTCAHRRRFALGIALGTAALLLGACSSVPLSTMWKFARFDRDAFLAIDPAQLRAAVLTDARATMKDVTIRVTLTPKDGAPRESVIALTEPVSRDARLPAAPAGRRWNIFALTPAAQREFATVREAAVRMPPGSSFAVRLTPNEDAVPPELMTRFPLRLDLQLNVADGWFTVLKDSEHDLTKWARRT